LSPRWIFFSCGSVHTAQGIRPKLATMLHDFLSSNRDELIRRCRSKVSSDLIDKSLPPKL